MQLLSTKQLAAALILFAGFGLSLSAKADSIGVTVGSTAGPFSQIDGDAADGYILSTPFSADGLISTYTFYAAQSGSITPILLTKSGNTFTVSAIGTTQSNSGSGQFTYSFGLVSGSASTTPDTYFGFVNSGSSNVAFDYTDPGDTYGGSTSLGNNVITYLVNTPGTGSFSYTPNGTTANNNVGGAAFREYDISATAVTPEPSSLILLGTGLMGIVGAGRRKFSKA